MRLGTYQYKNEVVSLVYHVLSISSYPGRYIGGLEVRMPNGIISGISGFLWTGEQVFIKVVIVKSFEVLGGGPLDKSRSMSSWAQ